MLRFSKVDNEDRLREWSEFADSFDHGTDKPSLPIYTASENGEMFAYWSVLPFPLILPAYHPEKTSPRRFKEVTNVISTSYCLSSISPQYPNGACFAAIPSDSAITGEIIGKVGFSPMNKCLYERIG